eukprot:g922.t1
MGKDTSGGVTETLRLLQLGVMPIILGALCTYLYKLLGKDADADAGADDEDVEAVGADKFANRGLGARDGDHCFASHIDDQSDYEDDDDQSEYEDDDEQSEYEDDDDQSEYEDDDDQIYKNTSREKRCVGCFGTHDGIEAVVTYIWVLCVIPVLMKQIFISWDCTMGDEGRFALDLDPDQSCPFNVYTLAGTHSLMCFIVLPLILSVRHVLDGCTRPRYMSHFCHDPHCDDCSKRRRFGFLFEKFSEKNFLWELVSMTRSIFVAAMGTFFTKRIVLQLSACIACNTIVLVAVLIRKPFLPSGKLKNKSCKQCAGMLGINNALEALLLLAEIFLWSAGVGNSILRRKTTIFAFVEWSGLACFLVGFGYCAKEILKLYVLSRCKKCKSKDESSDADVEMTATLGATELKMKAPSMSEGDIVTVANPLLQSGDGDTHAYL